MSAEKEVHNASDRFYAGLNKMLNGDAGSLSDIWSHGPEVTTLHPIGGRQLGWGEVWTSWEQVSKLTTDGKVELRDQLVRVIGDMAYEVGVEHARFKLAGRLVNGQARVTNVYRREADGWKITHHHTDIVPAMTEALGG